MKILDTKNELTRSLGFKAFLIFILVLLLMIATSYISDIIYDRQVYQREATASIIEPIGGAFRLNMTAISLPYTYFVKDKDNKPIFKKDYAFIMPNKYHVNVDSKMNILNRGIFKTPVYSADIEVSGSFEAFEVPQIEHDVTFLYDEAILILSSRNKQNFLAMPTVKVNAKLLRENKLKIPNFGSYTENSFTFHLTKEMIIKGFSFTSDMNIQGGESIQIIPMAGDNEITIKSDWKDPSFTGSWLPSTRDISEQGFTSTWKIPSFNTSFDSTTIYGRSNTDFNRLPMITTSFLLLNDTYQKTARSIKYSMLFICVPFFALFLCEMLTRKKIHVVQYALIGFANVIFYLLLLSISEHTNFNVSYFISSVMVITLTSMYVGSLTKILKLGVTIAIVTSIIYLFLFGILQLTDYALLAGSLGLFVVLAVAMYFTRNINFYTKERELENESSKNDKKEIIEEVQKESVFVADKNEENVYLDKLAENKNPDM